MTGVTILVSGEAFRAKVRQALGWFIVNRPRTAAAYALYCRRRRSHIPDKQGHWSADDEIVEDFEFPPMVPDMLRVSEQKSMLLYGIPCGIGLHEWEQDRKLMAIFRQECAVGNLTTMRGDCEGGG